MVTVHPHLYRIILVGASNGRAFNLQLSDSNHNSVMNTSAKWVDQSDRGFMLVRLLWC